MPRQTNNQIFAGVDIGTSKVVTLIGEVTPDNTVEVIGFGSQPSTGLKKGVVVNIDATVEAIQKATEEAELMAGYQVQHVIAGISGAHIHSMNSNGIVPIQHQEVEEYDVVNVMNAAKAIAIPADQQILHLLPQEFSIDNQGGIKDPIGMAGVRLEAKAHIITGSVSAAANIVKCIEQCGLRVQDIVLEQLASSYSVLSDDEKELGVCLVDIGGGTADIAVFTKGIIRHTAVIPIAGDHVTNDIAAALRIPRDYAETIKLKHGCCLSSIANASDMIELPAFNARPAKRISKRALAEIVEPRYEELFILIRAELIRSGYESLINSGIVFTGGGSKVEGAVELAGRVYRKPVRLGSPQHLPSNPDVLNNPLYATGVGLLLYGHKHQRTGKVSRFNFRQGGQGLLQRMRNWFKEVL